MINFEMSEGLKRTIIYQQGYEIELLDFGFWQKEYHNREVYIEDLKPGVMIDMKQYTVDDAVEYILGEAAKRMLLDYMDIN